MIRNTIVMTISVHQCNVILVTKHVHMTLFSEFFIIWRQIGGCSRDRCVLCSVFFYIFFLGNHGEQIELLLQPYRRTICQWQGSACAAIEQDVSSKFNHTCNVFLPKGALVSNDLWLRLGLVLFWSFLVSEVHLLNSLCVLYQSLRRWKPILT